jgi:hypothetical protein
METHSPFAVVLGWLLFVPCGDRDLFVVGRPVMASAVALSDAGRRYPHNERQCQPACRHGGEVNIAQRRVCDELKWNDWRTYHLESSLPGEAFEC